MKRRVDAHISLLGEGDALVGGGDDRPGYASGGEEGTTRVTRPKRGREDARYRDRRSMKKKIRHPGALRQKQEVRARGGGGKGKKPHKTARRKGKGENSRHYRLVRQEKRKKEKYSRQYRHAKYSRKKRKGPRRECDGFHR